MSRFRRLAGYRFVVSYRALTALPGSSLCVSGPVVSWASAAGSTFGLLLMFVTARAAFVVEVDSVLSAASGWLRVMGACHLAPRSWPPNAGYIARLVSG